jgi:uncharacterized membrane protein YcaP (DUF421 family)
VAERMQLMNAILRIDWNDMFVPTRPAEMILRGTVMYLALFGLLRVVLKRQWTGLGITDVLLVVLIADAAQNGMAGEYRSILDGLILVATIVGWAYGLDWLEFHLPWFERLLQPRALVLVERGHIHWRHMRKELITMNELMSALREEGVQSLEEVGRAQIESDGKISVIRRKSKSN